MSRRHQITINGQSFLANHGELLLDAALRSGVDLPHDCRAGHCGSCCVRLVSGDVDGGGGAEPGIVHACQCRISGDAVVERAVAQMVRTVEGNVTSLRPVSADVMEVGITTKRALPHLAGQYAKIRFAGFPSRPFSLTHPLEGQPSGRSIFLHVRRVEGGRVTTALGRSILQGHAVSLSGPFGRAHFRAQQAGRILLVASNTGFAPIWAIAVAALREDPERSMMVIAGGRSLHALYMGPALTQLARFPNTSVIPVCSGSRPLPPVVWPGRPTDYLPSLLPTDTVYACGAEGMVEAVKSIAAQCGATCHADPFVAAADDERVETPGLLTRAAGLLALPTLRRPPAHRPGRGDPGLPMLQFSDTTRMKRRLES